VEDASFRGNQAAIFGTGCCQQARLVAADVSKFIDGKEAFQSSQREVCGRATCAYQCVAHRERQGTRTETGAVGAIDPVQMTQQAENQEVLYISGWACSSLLTSTNEVSADFGDYPYNTVPNQVQRLFKAQQLHDRKHWDARRKWSADERKTIKYIDYLRPIIADGDTG